MTLIKMEPPVAIGEPRRIYCVVSYYGDLYLAEQLENEKFVRIGETKNIIITTTEPEQVKR